MSWSGNGPLLGSMHPEDANDCRSSGERSSTNSILAVKATRFGVPAFFRYTELTSFSTETRVPCSLSARHSTASMIGNKVAGGYTISTRGCQDGVEAMEYETLGAPTFQLLLAAAFAFAARKTP